MIKFFKNTANYIFLVLILSFIVKIVDLNYNSPLSDEAVYVAMGHSILFKWDWGIYNTASWLGGHSYFYPIISSIAYFYSGIVGPRFVNVLFSTIAVYFSYLIVNNLLLDFYGDRNRKRIIFSSLISSVVVAFSYSLIFISRLATYDMPSFAMLIGGIYFLIELMDKKHDDLEKAKLFFVSAILLATSFAFKYITALYIPVIMLVTYIHLKNTHKRNLFHYYKYYFLIPLAIFISLLSLSQINYLGVYVGSQLNREKSSIYEIVKVLIQNSYYLIPSFILSLAILIKRKMKGFLVLYLTSILIIILFHVLTGRVAALDKHSFLIVFFVSIFGSFGVYELSKSKWERLSVGFVSVVYVLINMINSASINTIWPNSYSDINFLQKNVKSSDMVLLENSSIVVVSSRKNFNNNNFVTFDWFEYKGISSTDAYAKSVFEGYFKYVELDKDTFSKTQRNRQINQVVKNNLDKNYSLVFEDDNSVIYKRVF